MTEAEQYMGKYIVVYNGTSNTVPVDGAGHMAEPGTWTVVEREKVADLLASEVLLETDTSRVSEGRSSYAVIMAKKEMEDRNRQAEPPSATPEPPAADEQEEPAAVDNNKRITIK